jgi:hypothetical protein
MLREETWPVLGLAVDVRTVRAGAERDLGPGHGGLHRASRRIDESRPVVGAADRKAVAALVGGDDVTVAEVET